MKKKIIISFISILTIIVISLVSYLLVNKIRQKDETKEQVLFNIKSSKEEPIKQGDIEVQNIDIVQNGELVKVICTLKNTSNKDVNGTFISINLLDENRNFVTVVAKNIGEMIPAKGKYKFGVNTQLPDENVKVKYAEIESMSHITREDTQKKLKETEEKILNNIK